MGNHIKPKFNKNWPKGGLKYFSPGASSRFRTEHPREYKIITTCANISVLLPVFLYMIIFSGVFHAPNSPWLMLGYFGSFVFGVGLYNIAAAWMEQYLGHFVTIICFAVGAVFVALSAFLLFEIKLSSLFDRTMVSFYFINTVFLLIPSICYYLFRGAVDLWLRQKRISKTMIRKLKKGKANFWWYQALHKKYGMGALYYINRIFTIFYPSVFLLNLLFGWIKNLSIPVTALSILCQIVSSLMFLFTGCQFHTEAFGRPFVLLARLPGDKYQSTLFDLLAAAALLAIAYAQVKMIAELWGFS